MKKEEKKEVKEKETKSKSKTTVKKDTKRETKKETKTEQKVSVNQEKALAITFVVLAVVVIILLIVALVMKNKNEMKDDSHITIPVLYEDTESAITINLDEIEEAEETEYVFIVSNYRNEEIAKENIEYDLEITNEDNVEIELYKNTSTKNLIKNTLEVEDNKLKKNQKQEDVYKLVIKHDEQVKEGSVITIEIDS